MRDVTVDRDNCVSGNNPEIPYRTDDGGTMNISHPVIDIHGVINDVDGSAPSHQFSPPDETIARLNLEVSLLLSECQRQKDLLVNGLTLTQEERRAISNGAYAMEEDAQINAITNEHLAAQALCHAKTLRNLLRRT